MNNNEKTGVYNKAFKKGYKEGKKKSIKDFLKDLKVCSWHFWKYTRKELINKWENELNEQ